MRFQVLGFRFLVEDVMKVIADLQLHSKYSRAVSQQMVISQIWEWAKRKGIGLVATGDWTHPLWMREIKNDLEEMGNGLLKLKMPACLLAPACAGRQASAGRENGLAERDPAPQEKWKNDEKGPLFLLATEVSSIYSQGGKLRRIHNLIWSPKIETAEKINKELIARGCNLLSDGRPIIGLKSQQVAELVFSIDPKCLIIPSHCWTPWFSLYGSESGFDSIEECFGGFAKDIYAVETGLSSNPAMNWRIKELDQRSIVSFSDAHSGPKLGREATVFDLPELSYDSIRRAIINQGERGNSISYTIEFYPEEGKYHYTGHRNCQVKQSPEETKKKGMICPVCGKKLTIGVMHRVEQLAGRSEEELKVKKIELEGTNVNGLFSEVFPQRPPFVMLVPLQEIIAEVIGVSSTSKNVQNEYQKLTDVFGAEFKVLLEVPLADIAKTSGERVADAIGKVRTGDIVVDPGFDGVFGVVKIHGKESEEGKKEENKKDQLSLF